MPRARYILEKQHEQSCNTKGSCVEVMKVIQLASEVHN